MGHILYVIAGILIIFWIIGYFAFNSGTMIHLLLVLASILILIRIIQRNKIKS